MNGYEIEARRHAREIVQDLRWQGVAVPSLYTHLASELQGLVASGDYAAWVASGPRTARALDRSVTRHARQPPPGPFTARPHLVPA